jgi:hypothetical protein
MSHFPVIDNLTSAGTKVPDWIANNEEEAKDFKLKMDEYNKKLWTTYNA